MVNSKTSLNVFLKAVSCTLTVLFLSANAIPAAPRTLSANSTLAPKGGIDEKKEIEIYEAILRKEVRKQFGADIEGLPFLNLKEAVEKNAFLVPQIRFEVRKDSVLAVLPGNDAVIVLNNANGKTTLSTVSGLSEIKASVNSLSTQLDVILPLLKDMDEDVRRTAVPALVSVYVKLIGEGKQEFLPLLTGLLKNQDAYVRKKALPAVASVYVKLIGDGKEVDLRLLTAMLKDKDMNVRGEVVSALATVFEEMIMDGKEVDIALLVSTLKNPFLEWQACEKALHAVASFYVKMITQGKEEYLALLTAMLKDKHEGVRGVAASALASLYGKRIGEGKPEYVPLLTALLKKNRSQSVREGAVAAATSVYVKLIEEGKKEYLPLLTALLKDGETGVRMASVPAVASVYAKLIGEGKEVDFSLLTEMLKDKDAGVRKEAVSAVASVCVRLVAGGKEGALSLLTVLLEDATWYGRSGAATVLASVYVKLIGEGKQKYLASLAALIGSPDWNVRRAAVPVVVSTYARLIGEGNQEYLPKLTGLLKDDDGDVRRAAASAVVSAYVMLIGEGKQGYLSTLTVMLKDPDEDMCRAAVAALGSVYVKLIGEGKQEYFPLLSELLNHSDWYVRRAAVPAVAAVYGKMIDEEKEVDLTLLTAKLKDADAGVRGAAAGALVSVYLKLIRAGKQECLPLLTDVLRDKDKDICSGAMHALASVSIEEIDRLIPRYIALIEKKRPATLLTDYLVLLSITKGGTSYRLADDYDECIDDFRKAREDAAGKLLIKAYDRILKDKSRLVSLVETRGVDAFRFLNDLFKAGLLPTPGIFGSRLTVEQIAARKNEIQSRMEGVEAGKPFDVHDPVDVDINYSILLRDTPEGTRLSYEEFIDYINTFKGTLEADAAAVDISEKNLIQLRALVYEAYKILELVTSMRKKSSRPIVVVANKSYGPFALSPIRGILTNMGVKIIDTKMGSTTCHSNPYRISWDGSGRQNVLLFGENREGAIKTFAQQRPHVIVVDGSYSLDLKYMQQQQFRRKDAKYPDAYQGYRNWFIALNQGIKDTSAELNLKDDFQKPDSFLGELMGKFKLQVSEGEDWQHEFSDLVKDVEKTGVKVGKDELYQMRFWTPASVRLGFCEATETHRHGEYRKGDPRKLDIDADLQRPTVVMVESALESKAAYPKYVAGWINTGSSNDPTTKIGENKAAYYDYKNHFNEFRYVYEPDAGVMLNMVYYRTAKQLLEDELLTIIGKQKEYAPYLERNLQPIDARTINACVFDLTGTLAPFTGKIPDPVAQRLNNLLRSGVKIAIVTDDAEKDDLQGRVIERIDPTLRKNLHVYLNGGNVLWQYDSRGVRKDVFDDRMAEDVKGRIEGYAGDVLQKMSIKGYQFEPSEYQVNIDLTEHLKSANVDRDRIRREIIAKIEKDITARTGIAPRIHMLGKYNISIRTTHKVEAVHDFIRRNNLSEFNLLISGNEAGSRRNDREMLKAFPTAVKVNVGKVSRNLSRKAAGTVYQIGISNNKGMADMEKLLGCFMLDKRLNLTKLDAYDIAVKPEIGEREEAVALKVPGTLGLDEDANADKAYIDSLLKSAVPVPLKPAELIHISDLVKTQTGRSTPSGSFEIRTITHPDAASALGIPKFKGAATIADQIPAVGRNENGKLVVYVTKPFYDGHLSANPMLLAEIIDHEYAEKMEGKSHRETAPRARLFANKDELSPYHTCIMTQLAQSDAGMKLLKEIVAEYESGKRAWVIDDTQKGYERLFVEAARGYDPVVEMIRKKYPGPRIGVIGAVAPTRPYSVDIGKKVGMKLREYVKAGGYVFTGGVEGVGLDVYRGAVGGDDRFFVLLPEGYDASRGYKEASRSGGVAVEHYGADMFERRLGMGKVADVVVVLNGGGGTLHEAAFALAEGKKVIALDYGGAGSALFKAKETGIISAELLRAGITEKHFEQIVLGTADAIDADVEAALGIYAVPPAQAETKKLEGVVEGDSLFKKSL